VDAYYNEVDGYCCDWLSNLMDAGLITAGRIDDRSIDHVRAGDLDGYDRCHFFAGIGGWDYALSLCGYQGPVWTGSCPCQPFSAAGQGKAADDERHLWPAWFSLIRECKPARIFGEQVEAAIGWGWLDAVFADLEAQGYACASAVLPACGVGAPHIRQRLWFVAKSGEGGCAVERPTRLHEDRQSGNDIAGCEQDGELGNAERECAGRDAGAGAQAQGRLGVRAVGDGAGSSGATGGVADAAGGRCEQRQSIGETQNGIKFNGALIGKCHEWTDAWWLDCKDGKARPVEPGTFPLAHGIPGRVGRLRAYGNAIVPQVAAEFIKAATEANND